LSPKHLRILREVATFAFILWIGSTALSWWRAPKLDSDTLPHLQGTLLDGNPLDTDIYKGKPLLIHFWGTWCPVCKQEAPNIARVAQRYNVLTIAVNSRNDAHIRTWMQEHGITYPVLNDPSGRWAAQFKVSVYPTNFIYNASGKLTFTEVGYSTTAGLLARMKMAE